MVDKEEIPYTMDMFCATLKIPVETPKQPLIPPTTLEYIPPFLMIVDYQGFVDKKYESIPKIIEEDYHSIKDDTPLVSVYTNGNVAKKGKRAAQETSLLRKSLEIRFKQQKPSTTTPPPLSDDQEHDEIHEVTQQSLALAKTTKEYKEKQNVVAVEEQLIKENVENIVEGEEEESDGIEFANTVFLDEEDSDDKLEPRSYKENPKKIDDDDDDEKKEDKKDDDVDNDDDDHTDHASIRTQRTGSLEIRTEKMQTPIPTPPRSPRIDLSSNKDID
ncbi:hypothetical protein Tco_0252659 [Tanacetum coccineum]